MSDLGQATPTPQGYRELVVSCFHYLQKYMTDKVLAPLTDLM